MRANPKCPECQGQGTVMLFLGPSSCKTCKGTLPAVWKCDPLDLLTLGGGYHSFVLLNELGDVLKIRTAFSVPIPPYECDGAPWQIGPRFRELGAGPLELSLYLIVRVPEESQANWEAEVFRPKSEDIAAVAIAVKGEVNDEQVEGLMRFRKEGQRLVGPIIWHILVWPRVAAANP